MKHLVRRILRNRTFPILLIRVFNTLSITFILVFLSRNLETDTYGNYITFWSTLTLSVSIGSIGMAAVLFNFSLRGWIEYYNGLGTQKLWTYILFTLLLAVLSALLLNHVLDDTLDLTIIYIGIIILASIYSFVLDNILIIVERSFSQLTINILYSAALIGIHYDFAVHHHQFDLLFFQYALIISVKAGIQFFIFRTASHRMASQTTFSELPVLIPDKQNWIQMSINEVFQFVMRYLDKFVVNLIATKEIAAVYFNGRQDIPFLSALYTSMGHGLLIELSKKFHVDDETVIRSMKATLKKLAGVILCITIFCLIYSEEIFVVIFTEKYIESVPIFRIGLLLLPAQFLLSLTYILQYKNHAKTINKGAYFDAVLTLILIFPLFKIFGVSGIILSIVISTYLQNFYYLIKIAQIFRQPPSRLLPYTYYLILIVSYTVAGLLSHHIFSLYFSQSYILLLGIFLGAVLAGAGFLFQIKNQPQNS